MFAINQCKSLTYLHDIINGMKTEHRYGTTAASICIIPIPKCKKEVTKTSCTPSTVKSWYSLNPHCSEVTSKAHH